MRSLLQKEDVLLKICYAISFIGFLSLLLSLGGSGKIINLTSVIFSSSMFFLGLHLFMNSRKFSGNLKTLKIMYMACPMILPLLPFLIKMVFL